MKRLGTLSLVAALVWLAPAGADDKEKAGDGKDFVTKAHQANLAEIKFGELAQERATNAEVKKFAKQMVEDHRRADTALQGIAAAGTTFTRDLDPKAREHFDRLSKLSGAEFDREYMKMMTDCHKKAIECFETASKDDSNPQAKAFATKMLPDLKKHLETAEAIASNLK